jgi:hypothetical protein
MVIIGIARRRRFSTDLKLAMLVETMQPRHADQLCWPGFVN